MNALLQSNRFKNVGVINEHTFLHRHFSKGLIEFFKIAHVSTTIDSGCFNGSVITFLIQQEDILHNMTAVLESNRLKNVGVIDEHTFLHRHFSKELIECFRISHVSSTIDS